MITSKQSIDIFDRCNMTSPYIDSEVDYLDIETILHNITEYTSGNAPLDATLHSWLSVDNH